MKQLALICFVSMMLLNAKAEDVSFERERLYTPPKTFDASQENLDFERPANIRPILYEGEAFHGKPSRVFAWYGVPTTGKPPYPAVVLVHGGGGTAFSEWVHRWNERGFAALAMDLMGRIPTAPWEGRAVSRPLAGGAAVNNLNPTDPIDEQWPYYAVCAIVRANSLLRSFPEIDKKRIGLVGISWGGFLSCITSGVDSRFQYVIPVYGCGFLGEPELTRTVKPLADRPEDERKLWLETWNPGVFLTKATKPVFFITDCDDRAYPLFNWLKSIRQVVSPTGYFVSHTFGHSHESGDRPEAVRFAKAMAGKATMPPTFKKPVIDGSRVNVSFEGGAEPFEACLLYVTEEFAGERRNWRTLPATVDGDTISAELPPGCVMAFLNLTDSEGTVSILVKE